MRHAPRWLALLLLCLPATAKADIASKLNGFEQEAREIGMDLPKVGDRGFSGQNRLVKAEIAFSLGDYDAAALVLFELATQPGPDQEPATYYLGESLYQKGDKGAARTYFAQVVAAKNTASRYYQPSLQRLVEISIAQNDFSDVDQAVATLDRGPEGIYVRGKLSFAQGKLDDALTYFNDVPKGSQLELQALYYVGTASVAKKDLARATEVFTDLVGRKPKSASERRIVEVSQLALGRLYYERDQLSKSIDSYLLVDRRSDLFPDALYEISWVYVKAKQYDKALRALELLALSEPQSTRTPTVRILEGNLHIRRAQMVRGAEITGAMLETDHDTPSTDYDKASQVFTETHDMFLPSYQTLAAMIDSDANAEQYLLQIAGRESHVFQAMAPLPEAAAQYLRDEPQVQRAVAVEADLGEIQANIAEAEATIARLEGVLAAADRTTVYPALASRRSRIGQIQDDLIAVRNDLADQQLGLVASSGELAQVSGARKGLAQPYATTPKAEQIYIAKVDEANVGYDAIAETTAEIGSAIGSSQAMAVALRKYANDPVVEGTTPVAADQKATINDTLASAATEAEAIENELATIKREITLGRDLAGVGDEGVAKSRKMRRELKAAQDAEHRVLAGSANASRDAGKSRSLIALGDRAARIADQLDQIEKEIDKRVDQGLEQAKVTIAQERTNIAGYKTELAEYEAEVRSLGGTVLGASFRDVKAKFYDIIIRTDVGNVDVAWSQKEDADDDLKRLNLSRQRELKQLKDEFKDILDGATKTPGTPTVPTPNLPPSTGPSGSPDKGAAETRIKPGTDEPQGTPLPNVKPDPKNASPKGGSK
jgi:tetratricopeptide (TPR) repeat protein